MRSVSFPSAELEMYFSVPWMFDTLHREESHEIPLLIALVIGPPLVSNVKMLTLVPRQTGIRLAVILSKPGSMMFPVISCETFELLAAFWPLAMV